MVYHDGGAIHWREQNETNHGTHEHGTGVEQLEECKNSTNMTN